MFSPPVSRAVTSADVKYAIERAFTRQLQNGDVQTYFIDLVGAPEGARPVQGLSAGIETPDEDDDRLQARRSSGAALAGALAMPISDPVPRSSRSATTADAVDLRREHAVFTARTWSRATRTASSRGFKPGRASARAQPLLQRRAGDFRPAFPDEIEFESGNDDTATVDPPDLTARTGRR